jgi:hypothetical protein
MSAIISGLLLFTVILVTILTARVASVSDQATESSAASRTPIALTAGAGGV